MSRARGPIGLGRTGPMLLPPPSAHAVRLPTYSLRKRRWLFPCRECKSGLEEGRVSSPPPAFWGVGPGAVSGVQARGQARGSHTAERCRLMGTPGCSACIAVCPALLRAALAGPARARPSWSRALPCLFPGIPRGPRLLLGSAGLGSLPLVTWCPQHQGSGGTAGAPSLLFALAG